MLIRFHFGAPLERTGGFPTSRRVQALIAMIFALCKQDSPKTVAVPSLTLVFAIAAAAFA